MCDSGPLGPLVSLAMASSGDPGMLNGKYYPKMHCSMMTDALSNLGANFLLKLTYCLVKKVISDNSENK